MLRKASLKAWRWTRNLDLSILIGIFVITGLLLVFEELADDVLEGDTESFDSAVLLMFRTADDVSDPIGPPYLEEMVRDVTALGGTAIISLTTLCVIGFLLFAGKRKTAFIVLFATLGAMAVSNGIKEFVDRPRPDLVPHGAVVYTASFPSSHSMQSAATYLTMGALLAQVQKRRRVKAFILSIALIITLLVGLSRIYLGVHWPTDVLAGWTAGAGWAILCWLLAGKLYKETGEPVV
ncbi:MAG: phosphatase PAP2 family protein [Pseudomonadota bacterium]